MTHQSTNGSRWDEAGRALATIADVASKYDMDGIDIHFLTTSLPAETPA